MIRSAMRNLIRKQLGETTAAFWTNDELNSWIDLAGHDVAYKTKCIQTSGLLTPVLDTSEYELASTFSNILSPVRVEYYQDGTDWMPLKPTDMEELDSESAGWKNADSSTPTHYYFDEQRNKTLGFYPAPDATNTGTGYANVYYAKDYIDMTQDSSSPSGIPDILQLAMVYFVVALGQETRGNEPKRAIAEQMYGRKLAAYMIVKKGDEFEDKDLIMKPVRNI